MITTFFLLLGYQFLNFLVGLLPVSAGVPTEWVEGVNTVWGYINSFSFIVPVSTLLSVLTLALIFHGSIFAYHALMWIIRKIPGMQ